MTFSPDAVADWQYRELPADPAAIATLSAACPVDLPEEYLALLAVSNGGCGPLAVEPGWFQLWPAGDVLALNRDYGVQQQLPFLFGFGSNGGGELLAFDTRRGPPWKIVMAPLIGMDEGDVEAVAEDFASFLEATGREAADA